LAYLRSQFIFLLQQIIKTYGLALVWLRAEFDCRNLGLLLTLQELQSRICG